MLSWINPKIEVRNSPIHGGGLFAVQDIHKSEIIIAQSGKIVADSDLNINYSNYLRICFPIEDGLHICPIEPNENSCEGAFRMNHSCNPNCGISGQIIFVAMRNIIKNEELTYDYAMTDVCSDNSKNLFDDMNCKCGFNECRKIINHEDWKNPILIAKYEGYFSSYVKEMQNKLLNI